MDKKNTQVSILNSYETILDGLMDLTGLSRGQIKKYYSKPSKLNSKLVKGRELTISLDLINYLKVNPLYSGPEVKVIAEDENFLILDKPSRVHMHPLGYTDTDNLVSFVISKFPHLDEVNKLNLDRGFIYRLDYETSGIVYYAKTTAIYTLMREQFKQLVECKTYLALVQGKIQSEKILTDTYLQKKGAAQVEINSRHGVEQVTIKLLPQKYFPELELTLVKIILTEGKRHQIRAQLSHHGHPIWGDRLYGGKSATGLFLHCLQYEFKLAGHSYNLISSHPELFDNFLNSYKPAQL